MRRSGLLLAACLLIVSCGGDGDTAAETTVAETTVVETTVVDATVVETTVVETTVVETTVTATEPEPEPDLAEASWTKIAPGGDCACADGSEFVFWDRPQDPTRLVLFLQGGGACFDATTCQYQGGTYSSTVGGDPEAFGGLFDFEEADNPIAGRSVVYVPYCTGDVHLGSAVADYEGLTVRHLGFVNVMAAIDHLSDAYPDLDEILVTGISAGSIPSPFYAAMLSDRYPQASITVLADGSGGYSRAVSLTDDVGAAWGADQIIPDWPSAVDMGLDAWHIPGLFARAAAHAPEITYARFDYAYDSVQEFFLQLTGVPAEDLLAEIDDNDIWIAQEAGIDLRTYTAAGSSHTVLLSDQFYGLETGGVRLAEWVAELLAGVPVTDVRCEVCVP